MNNFQNKKKMSVASDKTSLASFQTPYSWLASSLLSKGKQGGILLGNGTYSVSTVFKGSAI